jgi:Aldehyde oxidase and xanthine dehydrogenase, a/b hammerhead domain
MAGSHIWRSLCRLEDQRFLAGQGRYVEDIDALGELYGIVLRSSDGHALIEAIDAEATRAMPGGGHFSPQSIVRCRAARRGTGGSLSARRAAACGKGPRSRPAM